jgi:glycerol-1-phosphate dehydrogenase [NAD(P)+]
MGRLAKSASPGTAAADDGALRWIAVPSHLRVAATPQELHRQLAAALPGGALLVTGRTSGTLVGDAVAAALGSGAPLVVADNRVESAERLAADAQRAGGRPLVAVGGGKVIDVCKYAAHLVSRPFYCVPTQISHDGIGSPVAVLRVDGRGCPQSLGARMPGGIFVPLFAVATAPRASILSGIGDLLANLNAIADWRLAQAAGKDRSDDYAAMVSRAAARMVHAELAAAPAGGGWLTSEFLVRLTEALVLSGVAMEIAGSSRPCSGSEHMISHAMDELLGGVASHGLQVALGTVVASALRASDEEFKRLRELYRRLGLPVRPSDLGLSLDDFRRVMLHAPRTRPGRYTILDEMPLDAAFLRALHAALESGEDRTWTFPDSPSSLA